MSQHDTKTAEKAATAKPDWPSVGHLVQPLVRHLIDNAQTLRVGIEKTADGVTIVDAGIKHPGGLEAGRIITEICMGGLGQVGIGPQPTFRNWPWSIAVRSLNPVLACLGSQYAGWSLSGGGFTALGSGPARALAAREELFAELGYKDKADTACLVLEVDKLPPAEIIDKVSRDCAVAKKNITIILTPTTSLAGATQVVGRVLEVAIHKAHALHFPLERIVDGGGVAPLSPPGKDFLTGMGRTNDAIIFGGAVHLFVHGPDDDAKKLAHDLPGQSSRDYGKPFAQIFKDFEYDFYKIDPMLFAPAEVLVCNVTSRKSFRGGTLDAARLRESFGI